MAPARTFGRKQIGVALGMAAGAILTAAPFFWRPALVPNESKPLIWSAATLVAGTCLLVFVARLARHRFFSPDDIDGGGAGANSNSAALLQAQLQNTLEQTVLAIIAWAAWLAFGPPSLLGLVPVFAAYFVLGRLLFALGYAHGAPARALGFTLTYYPSVALVALALPRGLAVLWGWAR